VRRWRIVKSPLIIGRFLAGEAEMFQLGLFPACATGVKKTLQQGFSGLSRVPLVFPIGFAPSTSKLARDGGVKDSSAVSLKSFLCPVRRCFRSCQFGDGGVQLRYNSFLFGGRGKGELVSEEVV
jgi:hypothetical protein